LRSAGFDRAIPLQIWAVSDGKAGHANQALGLAEAIARRTSAQIRVKRVALRTPYAWLAPDWTPAPLQALTLASDSIQPPWPDIWIACGRQTAAVTKAVRHIAGRACFCVQLQDPRANLREFDLIVAPAHDGLEAPNLIPSLGALHRIHPHLLENAALENDHLLRLASPRLAVLIGGDSKRQRIRGKRASALAAPLVRLARTGASLMVSLSRRTGAPARAVLETELKPHSALWWDQTGPNPYLAMLALADHILVTADSVSMATEAAATGKPVHILPVDGQAGKLEAFHTALQAQGAARPFRLPLASWSYPILNESERIAERVLAAAFPRMRHGA
jgi:uncharacterized protein